MTDDSQRLTQERLDRLMRHADAVIARRRRGVEQATTQEEAERRERSLKRFMDQVARERDDLRDRLKRIAADDFRIGQSFIPPLSLASAALIA